MQPHRGGSKNSPKDHADAFRYIMPTLIRTSASRRSTIEALKQSLFGGSLAAHEGTQTEDEENLLALPTDQAIAFVTEPIHDERGEQQNPNGGHERRQRDRPDRKAGAPLRADYVKKQGGERLDCPPWHHTQADRLMRESLEADIRALAAAETGGDAAPSLQATQDDGEETLPPTLPWADSCSFAAWGGPSQSGGDISNDSDCSWGLNGAATLDALRRSAEPRKTIVSRKERRLIAGSDRSVERHRTRRLHAADLDEYQYLPLGSVRLLYNQPRSMRSPLRS